MTELLIPSRYVDVQGRGIETVVIDDSTGEVLLRAVTYDYWTQLDRDLWESFAPASLARAVNAPSRVKMALNHGGTLIGHAKEIEDKPDGLYARMAFSKTQMAQDARELVIDGTHDQCSMVFRPMADFMKVSRTDEGMRVRHERAHLLSVDLVPHGAYSEAASVVSVRNEDADLAREKRIAALRNLIS